MAIMMRWPGHLIARTRWTWWVRAFPSVFLYHISGMRKIDDECHKLVVADPQETGPDRLLRTSRESQTAEKIHSDLDLWIWRWSLWSPLPYPAEKMVTRKKMTKYGPCAESFTCESLGSGGLSKFGHRSFFTLYTKSRNEWERSYPCWRANRMCHAGNLDLMTASTVNQEAEQTSTTIKRE